MLDYIDYFGLPASVAICLVVVFFFMQFVGNILDIKGKAVPEIMNMKKHIKQRKKEREIMSSLPSILSDTTSFLNEIKERYNDDNIAQRNNWMKIVDERGIRNEKNIDDINSKLDKHSEYIISLIVDNKRNVIIDFASRVANSNNYFTREQFNRIFKIHNEYEQIIEEQGMTNGEVDIAFRIIEEAYMDCIKNNTFIEDLRGYC